jgi:sugar phosphate permease
MLLSVPFRSSVTLIFATLTAAYFLSYFFRSANAVIAEDLIAELKLDSANLGLMTSLFYLAFAGSQPMIGWALDKYGSRLVQPVLLTIAVLGALLFSSAEGFAAAAITRGLLGAGLAGCLMAAFKTFAAWFPASRYATAIGALMAIGTLGSLFAASPLAAFSSSFGWRSVFLIGAGLTFLVALSIFFLVRNTPNGDTLEPVHQSVLEPVQSVQTPNQLNYFDSRLWRVAFLNLFAAGGLLSIQTLWGGKFLFDIYQLEKSQVGVLLTLLNLGAVIGYGIMGFLIDRLGATRVAIAAMFGLMLCEVLMAARVELVILYVVYFLFGLIGTGNLALLTHSRQLFPTSLTGRATTFVNMFGIGGTFLLQTGIGFIVSSGSAGQYSLAFGLLVGLTLLAWLLYIPLATSKSNGNF